MFHSLPFRLLFVAFAAFLASGCQARFPVDRIPKMVWLVLPLEQPPAMKTTPRAIQGWWFGARTIRQNPRAGALAADHLSRRLAGFDFVHLYSNIDLRYYFNDKRQALAAAYPYLESEEIDRLIDQVPKVEFGRELGADKILSGRIIRLYMAENRTIHWWWSVGEIEFRVIDVVSGEIIWQRRYHERQQFASEATVLDAIIDRLSADLQHEYFFPLAE